MSEVEWGEDDILTEICWESTGDTARDIELISRAPIRVTDVPTGISAVGEGQGSQVRNYEKAIERLRHLLSQHVYGKGNE